MSRKSERFLKTDPISGEVTVGAGSKVVAPDALTFDDVLLVPSYSEVLPSEIDVSAQLTGSIGMRIPIISAAMDTVTEAQMAIALARQGGIGVIHKNMPPELQAEEVDKVKRSESGMIVDPITMGPDKSIADALALMKRFSVSGIPIVDDQNKLLGILTNRDLRFLKETGQKISEVMTSKNLVTAPEGTSLETSQEILHKNRIEKLLIVDDGNRLKGMITVKDIMKKIQYPSACKDSRGRLRCAAGVGVGSDLDKRAAALVKAGVDALVVDSSHGHSKGVLGGVERLRSKYPDLAIIAGNVATGAGTRALIEAGANSVKVGIGPGSICTTRVVTGCGVPQITAIMEAADEADRHDVPVIADGGIRYSGDIVKALAAGASSVMLGSLFAGCDESPGETVLYEGRSFKIYRGMGSQGAMRQGSADRYFQQSSDDLSKFVPEGVEGMVPSKGSLVESIYQLIGGVRSGMGLCGAATVADLREKARFVKITGSGVGESHPHSISISKEPPNYRRM